MIANAYKKATDCLWDTLKNKQIESLTQIEDAYLRTFLLNWVSDATMVFQNAKQYDNAIKNANNILSFDWSKSNTAAYNEAKRSIADSYADGGDVKKSIEKYNKYLREDSLWTDGYYGYLLMLRFYDIPLLKKEMTRIRHLLETKPVIVNENDFNNFLDLYEEFGSKDDYAFFQKCLGETKKEASKGKCVISTQPPVRNVYS